VVYLVVIKWTVLNNVCVLATSVAYFVLELMSGLFYCYSISLRKISCLLCVECTYILCMNQ
jgi:hypothetical protein